jgi:hypothetical protein
MVDFYFYFFTQQFQESSTTIRARIFALEREKKK